MNDQHHHHLTIDWRATALLGIVASMAAAIMAVALAGRVPEPAIIVSVIIVSSVASWYQLEFGRRPVARR